MTDNSDIKKITPENIIDEYSMYIGYGRVVTAKELAHEILIKDISEKALKCVSALREMDVRFRRVQSGNVVLC